jgi:hypothetical protein
MCYDVFGYEKLLGLAFNSRRYQTASLGGLQVRTNLKTCMDFQKPALSGVAR